MKELSPHFGKSWEILGWINVSNVYRTWWYKPKTPATQENCRFKANLGNLMRKREKGGRGMWRGGRGRGRRKERKTVRLELSIEAWLTCTVLQAHPPVRQTNKETSHTLPHVCLGPESKRQGTVSIEECEADLWIKWGPSGQFLSKASCWGKALPSICVIGHTWHISNWIVDICLTLQRNTWTCKWAHRICVLAKDRQISK